VLTLIRNLILITTIVLRVASSETVSFLVIDDTGKSLSGWKVTKFKKHDRDFAVGFKGLTGADVDWGVYDYELSGPSVTQRILDTERVWTPKLTGRTSVGDAENFVVVTADYETLGGLAIDGILPQPFVIRGKIEPMPPQSELTEPVRIQLHSIFDSASDLDIQVDSSGEFRIYRALGGLCLLTVIQGTSVLHVQPVFFEQGIHSTSFALKIDSPPALVRVAAP